MRSMQLWKQGVPAQPAHLLLLLPQNFCVQHGFDPMSSNPEVVLVS